MWLNLGEWLLNRRWWLVVVTSLSVFLFEWLEYDPFLEGVSIGFFEEILFYGVALPLSTGVALSWVSASRAELSWINYYQNLTNNLVIQLQNAHSWRELATVLLSFFQITMPLAGATIFTYEQHSQRYKPILNWQLKEDSDYQALATKHTAGCACLNSKAGADSMILQPCRDPGVLASAPKLICLCIPFLFSDSLVGGARLFFFQGNAPSSEQYRLLREVAPKIAAEFHRIQLEWTLRRRKYSLGAEQQRIARDVHDTLGHSLAFLRLRLDHISMEFEQAEMLKVRQEVESLRDVAKEAYDQMREVLTQLNSQSNSDLNETLINYADKISQQADFELDIQQEGQSRELPPLIQRNIFLIFREILTNIEKHAQARHVDVRLRWHDAHLEVDVSEDGIGFDPVRSIGNNHFGLKNMQDRANEIHAQFTISSTLNHGTFHTLRVPYEVTYEADHRGRPLTLSQWPGKPL